LSSHLLLIQLPQNYSLIVGIYQLVTVLYVSYCTPHTIKENSETFSIHRCNYILLSQVYCVWQVVKTPTIIFNNPV